MTDVSWQILVVVLLIAVVVEGALLIGVMRQLGGVLMRISPVGRPGDIEGGPEIGAGAELPGLARGRPALVLFVSAGCDVCEATLQALPSIRRHYPDLQVLAVPGGDEDERAFYTEKLGRLARPDLFSLYETWEVVGTPFGVAVGADLRVRGSGVVNNLEHVETLVEVAVADPPPDAPVAGNGRSTIPPDDLTFAGGRSSSGG